jgi:mRNA-degrading endonuclease YafQ of YafQ-DinJ toxin-antitoxin module
MPEIIYTPRFLRLWNKLSPDMHNDVALCIQKLQNNPQDPSLRTHKLSGHLTGSLSASANYSHRIVFEWEKDDIVLLAVGDHDVYR